MEKMYKIKDIKELVGELNFLSCMDKAKVTIGTGRAAKEKFIGYRYQLLSAVQDDVTVVVRKEICPQPLTFGYMANVELVNPVLVAVPKVANRRAYIDWEIHCDNIKRSMTIGG
jgi:hypothetical protein